MERSFHWVKNEQDLARRLESIGARPLALDTEADSLHHYPEKVCLIQLSFGDCDLLVDPLNGMSLDPLDGVLRDPGIPKLLHAADYDLRVLDRDFGLRIHGLFDTMIAARLTGEAAFGLAALLKKHFDVELDKRFQRADWSRRPLSPEMERYAVMDTRYLVPLARGLEEQLEQLGRRDWAAEEFQRQELVRWNRSPDPEPFRRVKGSAALDRRQLATLRELVQLRETLARERDRPPFRVLQDGVLLELARTAPVRRAELNPIAGLPRRGWDPRPWLEAIARAGDLPETALPERQPRVRGTRPSARAEKRIRALCKARDRVAHEIGLEPSVVGARGALESLLEALDGGEAPNAGGQLREWQFRLLAPFIQSDEG